MRHCAHVAIETDNDSRSDTMPDRKTMERAAEDKREGKAPTTQAAYYPERHAMPRAGRVPLATIALGTRGLGRNRGPTADASLRAPPPGSARRPSPLPAASALVLERQLDASPIGDDLAALDFHVELRDFRDAQIAQRFARRRYRHLGRVL